MLLQRIQGLQRSELGLAVLTGLKNREQPAAFFRESAGLFRHHPAAINLNFQSKIAHFRNLPRRVCKRNDVPDLSCGGHRCDGEPANVRKVGAFRFTKKVGRLQRESHKEKFHRAFHEDHTRVPICPCPFWSIIGGCRGAYGHGGAFRTYMVIDPKVNLIGVLMVQHAGGVERDG